MHFQQDPLHDLDFDNLSRLAKEDPESFEATRQVVIEDLIESFPMETRERMRRLQWRIDQERRLAKSPMGSCIRLSRMMWRQLLGDGGLRDRLNDFANGMQQPGGETPPPGVPSARILSFSRPAD
jgi:hypothetical protein